MSETRLYAMRVGTIRGIAAPVPSFLLVSHGVVALVDTGADARPKANGATPSLLTVDPDQVVTAQLARLGFCPADIDLVLCTHLDPDHSGYHDVFPDAEFVVQETHLGAARAGAIRRIAGPGSRWATPGLRYRGIRGDVELLPDVHLVESGGHVPGHQSVLVRLRKSGPVLLAGDAIPMACCLDPDSRPVLPFDLDAEEVRRSTRKLKELAEAERALVVFGHDGAQWPTLRTAPDHYS